MTDFTNQSGQEFIGTGTAEIGQAVENSANRINPDSFYKRQNSEPAGQIGTQTQAKTEQAGQIEPKTASLQAAQGQEAPQQVQSSYYIELANAIKNNAQLRQRFLEIVNSQQADTPMQNTTPMALARPLLDSENGTQPSNTCALDFSLADVESRMPNYFSGTPARSMLRDYLRANCPNLPTDELYKVLNLAIGLENQAIENYKNRLQHQKNLNDGNAAAISKLSTNSALGKGSGLEFNKIFTRAEIRTMPLEDFRKNEKEIFAQYRAGLIK